MEDLMTSEYISIPTGIIGAGVDDVITITQNALDIINMTRNENKIGDEFYLRIGTRGGGCQGMNFILGFDSEIDDADRILQTEDLSLLIDSKSLFYTMGVTLDYIDGPNGSGFVFHSPNNEKTCGCHG